MNASRARAVRSALAVLGACAVGLVATESGCSGADACDTTGYCCCETGHDTSAFAVCKDGTPSCDGISGTLHSGQGCNTGCGGDMVTASPLLSVDIFDQQTAVGDRPLHVMGVTDLAGVSLRTYPELGEVAVSKVVDAGPAFEITPTAKLDDRWYVIRVDVPGARMTQATALLSDGTRGVRFRPGSDPRWIGLRLCASSDTVGKVIFDLSEPLAPIADLASVVSIRRVGETAPLCTLTDGASKTGDYAIGGRCPLWVPGVSVTASIGVGLTALSGKPVPARSITVAVVAEATKGCAFHSL